jgi:transcriptional regulator with GAF, ATPase, and Fis domain
VPDAAATPSYSDHDDFAVTLAEAARTINQPQSLEETLDAIARTARASVPGFDAVGISLVHSDGSVETKAATGDLVWELDRLQYDLGEGPCVSSLRDEPVLVVEDLRHEQRWPRFVPPAVERGLRAQMALRLYVDDQGTIGGINLYSTSSDTIAHDAPAAAQVFAAHAAVTLGHVQEVEHLHAALRSRQQIGTAVGILIERYQLDQQGAFNFLTRLSSHSNTKLRDVAERIVEDAMRQRAGR